MKVITAPNDYSAYVEGGLSVFLAGGISGCPDWQAEYAKYVQHLCRSMSIPNLILLNPRRPDFDTSDPNASRAQIEWEFRHLALADAISFWFPKETLCPITLYELGKWTMYHRKPIFIGVHPEYKRREDVDIQTGLERPEVEIVYDLADLTLKVCKFAVQRRESDKMHQSIAKVLKRVDEKKACRRPLKP